MLRVIYFAMGLLLMASSLHVSRRLILDRDLLVLAAVSPALLAALAFGGRLLVQSMARRKALDADGKEVNGTDKPFVA